MPNKRFYSVKEASKILGVSTNTIYKYLDEGSLKGKRLNSRGRFKIPFSEIAPYLATEVSGDAAGVEEIQPGKKIGEKLTVWELWLGVSLVGLVLIYVLGYKSSLLTDIGSAVVGYSGRTFSGFGNLISRLLPTHKEIVSEPLSRIVAEETTPDLNYKIQETGGRTNELYANAQVLSASTQSLLGKSKTLTSAELTDAIGEMLLLLGSQSDSPDKKTIFAEINWLADAWDFPTLTAIKRAGSNVSYLLAALQRQSLGAFTKPEASDLDNLVSEADKLQGLVGNLPDTVDKKTLFGNIKAMQILTQALETKISEIDKILEFWESYSLSEKEDAIKLLLSESLSINKLPKVEELIFSQLVSSGEDTDLKNSLLALRGVLVANQTYLTQEAGKSVVATWTESENSIFKALAVNPSPTSGQETQVKYYLPAEAKKEEIKPLLAGYQLNFDDQRGKYYVETRLVLNAGEAKTLSFNLGDIWIASANSKDSTASQGQVAGIRTFNYPTRSIVIWGSLVVLFSALATLIIHLRMAIAAFFVNIVRGLLKVVSTITGLANLIVSIATSLKLGILTVIHATTTFFVNIASAVSKAISATITSLSNLLSLTVSTVVAILASFRRGILVIIHTIVMFFTTITSVVIRTLVSIKTGFLTMLVSFKKGLLAILFSIKAFFSKTLSLTVNLTVAIGSSLKRGFVATIHAITTITTFFVNAASATTGTIISITNLIVATFTSLKRGFLAIIHAVTTFIVNVASAVTAFFVKVTFSVITFINNVISVVVRATTSTIRTIQKALVSVTTFFLKILFSVTKTMASLIRRLLKSLVLMSKLTESALRKLNFE